MLLIRPRSWPRTRSKSVSRNSSNRSKTSNVENEQLRRDLGLEVVARQADVKMGGRAENIQLGGLVQVQGESGDRRRHAFQHFERARVPAPARVNLSGRFVEEFNFRAELELAGSLTGRVRIPRADDRRLS